MARYISKNAVSPTLSNKNNIKRKTNKKKTNKKNIKRKRKYIWFIVSLVLFVLALITYGLYLVCPFPSIFVINKIYVSDDNLLNLNFSVLGQKKNDVYCMFNTSGELPSLNDKNWVLSNDGYCSTTLDDNIYYAYLKDSTGKITKIEETSKFGKIMSLNISNESVYLALNGKYDLDVSFEKIGYLNEIVKWNVLDDSIASVDEDGMVTGIKPGVTTVSASLGGKTVISSITVTNLITSNILKDGYDFNKPEIKCNQYTKEENDLIDDILSSRINEVGYKTRAGVVEAARFLVLEFPYRINYFFENGRKTINNIDGEGRYFHKGLYLDESRFSSLSKSANGPQTWGCSLYSVQSHKKTNNGLNCSGFVTWSIVNGGFDIKDVGARMVSSLDITDYGKVTSFTSSIIKDGTVKVGDLVHSTHTGGHIGIIIGIDNNNVYVAHALWESASSKLTKRKNNISGVQITKYTHNEVGSVFPNVVLMDSLYKEDGELTNMW